MPTPSYRPSHSHTEKEEDSYDAKDYDYAENFYEDQYDDSFDFNDAENYFDEHN